MLRAPQWLFVGRFAALAERSFSIPATLSNQHPTVRREICREEYRHRHPK
jgi:hypothetical protein